MSGYCATGRVVIESAPASAITGAMTQAKTGRSMKKLAIAYLAAVTVAAAPAAGLAAGTDAASGGRGQRR